MAEVRGACKAPSKAAQGSARQRNATQRNATHRGAVLSSGSASRPSWDKDVAGLDMTGSESPRSRFGSVQSERLSKLCPFPLDALSCSAAP
jgi:hypothetical protein